MQYITQYSRYLNAQSDEDNINQQTMFSPVFIPAHAIASSFSVSPLGNGKPWLGSGMSLSTVITVSGFRRGFAARNEPSWATK